MCDSVWVDPLVVLFLLREKKVPYNPDIHHRRSVRLQGYNYAQAGGYFITITTWNRECILGDIKDSSMRTNKFGDIVRNEWIKTAELRKNALLDEFVIMPNHIHGIIVLLYEGRGTEHRAPTTEKYEQFGKPTSNSIPTIIRSFKAITTKRINTIRNSHGLPIWQRNYYEHIIRNEHDMTRIREYIQNNPLKWEFDEENPDNLR